MPLSSVRVARPKRDWRVQQHHRLLQPWPETEVVHPLDAVNGLCQQELDLSRLAGREPTGSMRALGSELDL